MRAPTHRQEHTGDPTLDRMQANVRELIALLRGSPFVVGKLISVRFKAGEPKIVTHGLGKPAACLIVRQAHGASVAPRFMETEQGNLDPSNQLRLVSTETCSVDFWFYPRASRPVEE